MSSEERAVVLTNNDPNIIYVGEWTTVDASTFSNSGGWGAAFSPTLHSTTTNSSFSFSFHGSTILVIGTDNVANLTTDPDPTWQCFIDGTSLGSPILQAPIQNNWVMCSDSNLPDGLHELTVNVTSRGMPFYLDSLQYRASPSVSLENTLIAIYPGDPSINFISGWSPLSVSGGNQTSDPNSLVNLTFVGTQLSWYGFLPAGPTSSGKWSIDGAPFQSFQVTNSIPDTSNSGDNQLFFMTPILDMGPHELSVKYTGTPGQIPLTFEYFLIKNGTSPTTSSTSHGSFTKTGTGPHTSSTSSKDDPSPVVAKKGSSTAGIVGGVISSIVGMTIIVFVAFIWFKIKRRRRQTRRDSGDSIDGITPYHLYQPPSAPPLQISQVPKSERNVVSVQYSNPNSIISNSLFPISSQSSPPEAVTTVSSETNSSRHPLPVTATQTSSAEVSSDSRFIIQYEDSGIRLRPSAVGEAIEVPPTYTEQ